MHFKCLSQFATWVQTTCQTFLKTKWQSYLDFRGHYIYRSKQGADLVISKNSHKMRYRWLLLVSGQAIRRLSVSEQAHIHRHIRQANTHNDAAYLVVGFTPEPRRIVILPAKAALKAKCVRSDTGGIAWED